MGIMLPMNGVPAKVKAIEFLRHLEKMYVTGGRDGDTTLTS
jgi:hypothetical protein